MESHLRKYSQAYMAGAVAGLIILLGIFIVQVARNANQTETIIHGKANIDFTNGEFNCTGAPKEICEQIEKSFRGDAQQHLRSLVVSERDKEENDINSLLETFKLAQQEMKIKMKITAELKNEAN